MKMNNIDKILKESIKGYEAPFDPAMWDKISGELSPMEDAFRDATKDYEAPYNANAWNAIKGQIGSSSSSLIQWVAGSAALIAITFGAIALIPSDTDFAKKDLSDTNSTNKSTQFSDNNTINSSNDQNTNTTDSFISLVDENTTNENNADVNNLNENVINETNNLNDENVTLLDDSNNVSEESNPNPTLPNLNSTDQGDGNDESDEIVSTEYFAEFSTNETEICEGETILFNPKLIKNGISHIWNFGDGTILSQKATSHLYERAGSYSVTLTVKDIKTNKVLASSEKNITVNELPVASFTTYKTSESIPSIDFVSDTKNTSTYLWKINDRVVSDQQQFTHTFRVKGYYTVELLTTNQFGCKSNKTSNVEIENNYNLLAANAFSPNNDDRNNTFIPSALLSNENEFTMTIHDQFGNFIYKTNSSNRPWNGRKMSDNSDSPAGMYVWSVTLKNANGISENYRGQVLLIR